MVRGMGMMSRNRNHVILMMLFMAWVIAQCQKTAISIAIIPIRAEFGFNSIQAGWIISSFFVSYAVLTLFGGILADRYGAGRVLPAIILIWSAITGATAFAWSFTSFVVARFLCGAAEGGFPSASSVAIADLYPVEQRGRAKSFVVSAAQIGSATGTVVVAAFIASGGWRYAFWAYGVVGILVAAALWLSFRLTDTRARVAKTAGPKVRLSTILRSSLLWRLFLLQFCTGTFFFGLNSWLPSYWVQVKHLSMAQMSTLTATSALAAFVIQNLFGWIIDRYFPNREKYLICACLAVATVSLIVMYMTDSPMAAFGSLSVANTVMGVASSAAFIIAIKYFPKETVGTATGIANLGQQSAGALAPILFGYLISAFHGSFAPIFVFAVAATAVAFAAALGVDTSTHRARKSEESGDPSLGVTPSGQS